MIALMVVFLLMFILIIFFLLKKYLKNRKIAKIGVQGEKSVSLILNKLNKKKYHVINNLILKHPNGKTSQIDHVVVSRKGVFVIETKNYSGIVKGSLNKEWWTHICGKNKHVVYNIVYQNQGHINAVKNNISDFLVKNIGYGKYKKIFFSVLVFKESCVLKIKKPFFLKFRFRFKPKFKICNFGNLIKYIKKRYRRNIVSKKDYKQLILELENNNIFSKKNLKIHINNIKY